MEIEGHTSQADVFVLQHRQYTRTCILSCNSTFILTILVGGEEWNFSLLLLSEYLRHVFLSSREMTDDRIV